MERQLRLRNNRDFSKVYKKGRKFWNRHFTLFIFPQKQPGIRIGFSVTTKYGKSCRRNRIKRQLKEICRHHLSRFPKRCDVVIIPGKNTYRKPYRELEKELLALLSKVKKA